MKSNDGLKNTLIYLQISIIKKIIIVLIFFIVQNVRNFILQVFAVTNISTVKTVLQA